MFVSGISVKLANDRLRSMPELWERRGLCIFVIGSARVLLEPRYARIVQSAGRHFDTAVRQFDQLIGKIGH